MRTNRIFRVIHTPFSATSGASLLGLGVLVLLFLASVAYVTLGGALTLEASPAPNRETSKAEVAVMHSVAGGASAAQGAPAGSATVSEYFPAGYVNRGRDGDGNVMTYEHD